MSTGIIQPQTGRRVLPPPEGPNLSKTPRLVSSVLCYHQTCDPTTHHINLIASNKHRQLAHQVGVVVEIISTGLMAPINFRAITFVPGTEFTFGSLSFSAGADGRLHVSNPEATSIGQIVFDRAERIFTRSVSEPDSDRLSNRFTPPRYPFGFRIR